MNNTDRPTYKGSRRVKVPAGYQRAGRWATVVSVTETHVEAFVPQPRRVLSPRIVPAVKLSILISDLA